MAAPSPVARGTPTGFYLKDGFSTKIAFQEDPGIQFWERTVKPMGFDGGEGIDISTMFNTRWHTMYPRTLLKMANASGQAAYDPDVFPAIVSYLNFNNAVTVHFPTNDQLTVWGWLAKMEPGELKEGEFPEAAYEFIVSNYDPVGNVEAGPVYSAAGGT